MLPSEGSAALLVSVSALVKFGERPRKSGSSLAKGKLKMELFVYMLTVNKCPRLGIHVVLSS